MALSPLAAIIFLVHSILDDEDFDDEPSAHVAGSGEGLMEDKQGSAGGARRNEDIALDLMRFIAMATGYGKTATGGGAGFTGGTSASKPEDHAAALLELYGKCVKAIDGKK